MLVTRRAGSNPVSGTLNAFLIFSERLFLFHPVLTYISFNFETMYNIETNRIKVSVSEKGAELQSFFDKKTGIEYMWDANPAFWAKHSPILFPIVGTLKDNTYFFQGKSYKLGRHGFARDMVFELKEQTTDNLHFLLISDSDTLNIFPFDFEFSIIYTIIDNMLSVTYHVKNTGKEEMYFSVGGHPAFKVPIFECEVYSDYVLEFNETENASRWPITSEGLIGDSPSPFVINSNVISLSKDLFKEDAIVLKQLNSTSVKLISKQNRIGLNFDFEGFPFLGIWAVPNADFVCIEPWCGIADSANTTQELTVKEGIHKLASGNEFERTWSIEII